MRATLRAGLAIGSAVACVGCQVSPATGPDAQPLPSCFADGVPPVRPGMSKVRLRWVYRSDTAFRPQSAEISMDGQRSFESRDQQQLERELVRLADVDLAPGQHQVNSRVRISGWGSGLFAYLKDYRADLPNEGRFSLEPGEVRCISVVAYYREGLTLPIEERPRTAYVEERAP